MDASSSSGASETEVVDLVEAAYQYITDTSYPDGCSKEQKRTIRRKATKFVVRNGVMFFKKKKKKGKVSI